MGGDDDRQLDAMIRAAGLLADRDRDECPERELIDAYRSGALSEPRRAEVEAHLASCATCRSFLVATAFPPPPKLEALALDALERGPKKKRWRTIGTVLTSLAALALVAIFAPSLVRPPRAAHVDFGAYAIQQVDHAVKTERGSDATRSSSVVANAHYEPASLIEVIARRPASADLVDAVTLVAYVEEEDGTLRPAPKGSVTASQTKERAFDGTFRFEAEAHALFGDVFGLRKLHLVLIEWPPKEPPPDLTGLSREAAEPRLPHHRWATIGVRYQPEGRTPAR